MRAPDGYDVHAALEGCADLLERFGGHKAAGGFTVKGGRFDEFREAFAAVCAAQHTVCGTGDDKGLCEPEMWIEPSDLTMEMYAELMTMAPFGEGNPEPIFGLRGVTLADVRLMGDNGKHAAFVFCDRRIPRATWWGHGMQAEPLRARSAERFDITFTVDSSEWGGESPHLELRLCGLAPSMAVPVERLKG